MRRTLSNAGIAAAVVNKDTIPPAVVLNPKQAWVVTTMAYMGSDFVGLDMQGNPSLVDAVLQGKKARRRFVLLALNRWNSAVTSDGATTVELPADIIFKIVFEAVP